MYTLTIFLLTTLLVGSGADPPPADISTWQCYRDGCSGNGRCHQVGFCICDDQFTGYNCEVPKQNFLCQINPDCVEDNTMDCHRVGGVDTCACRPGWTGVRCEIFVSTVKCNNENFYLDFKTPPAFDADSLVYPVLDPMDSGSDCVSRPTSPGEPYVISMHRDCGVTEKEKYLSHGKKTTQSVTLVFQFNPNVLTRGDVVVVCLCIFDELQKFVTGEVIPVSDDNSGLDGGGTIEVEIKADEHLRGRTYLEGTSQRIYNPTQGIMGDRYGLTVTIDDFDNSDYGGVRFVHCWVDDNDNGATPIQLIKDGCINEPEIGRISAFGRGGGGVEIGVIEIYVLKFVTSDELRLRCDIRVCRKSNLGPCQDISDCDSDGRYTGIGDGSVPNDPGKRKRRESDDELAEITSTIKVKGFGFEKASEQSGVKKDSDCSVAQGLLILVAVLAVLTLLLAVVAILTLCRYMSRKRSKLEDMKTLYSNYTH